VEDKDSNSDVSRFEDIDDLSSNNMEVEAVEGTPASQTNSNFGKDKESPRSTESSSHVASGSRTRTVSFSQKGYSEELFKVGQHLRTAVNGEFNEKSALEIQPPPGFESVRANQGYDPLVTLSKPLGVDVSTRKIGNDHSSQNTFDVPPGFEVIHTTQSSPQKRLVPKQKRDDRGPASIKNKKALLKPSSVSTNKTSESLVRLAHESLEIEKILGVRMTRNEQAAVSRITKPLKNRKAKGESARY